MHRVLSVRPEGFDALERNSKEVSFEIELCTIMALAQWDNGEAVELLRCRVVKVMAKVDVFACLLGDAVIAQMMAQSFTV